MSRPTFKLEGFCGHDDPELVIVGGPHPYVWIGTEAGALAATKNTAQLRKLRDALTKALASAAPQSPTNG